MAIGEDDDRDLVRPAGPGTALAEIAARGDDERPVLPHSAALDEVTDREPRAAPFEGADRVDRLDLDDDGDAGDRRQHLADELGAVAEDRGNGRPGGADRIGLERWTEIREPAGHRKTPKGTVDH